MDRRTLTSVMKTQLSLLLLLLMSGCVRAAHVSSIKPWRISKNGGEIAIHGSGFAEDQYSQFQPELGNIVNFVNEWDSVPCKVNVYKTSPTRIVCTVGAPRASSGLSEWYILVLSVDGEDIDTQGRSLQFSHSRTPLVYTVQPGSGTAGSLVTIGGRFFTAQYAETGDLDSTDQRQQISWIRVGNEDCDPIDAATGQPYGMTDSMIVCRTSVSYSGPLSVQVMVAGRGLSMVRNMLHRVAADDTVYDFLSVPEVTDVTPTAWAAQGGTLVTVQGMGFDPAPNKTRVLIGGAECRVVTSSQSQLTCAAPAEADTTPQLQGDSGVLYEVWPGAEVDNLGDLSTLTQDADGYSANVLLDASVTNSTLEQGSNFVGRMSGWLRAPRTGQFALTLKSAGKAQLTLGTSRENMESEVACETPGNFGSVKKSDMINMTAGQWTYFEAVHQQGSGSQPYRMEVGMIDYDSPVAREQTSAATTDSQTLYVKGKLRMEQQVIRFENWPSEGSDIQLEFNGARTKQRINTALDIGQLNDTWRSAVMELFTGTCEYTFSGRQVWQQTFEEDAPDIGSTTGIKKNETIEPWCGKFYQYKPWGELWRARNDRELVDLRRYPWLCLAHWGRVQGLVKVQVEWTEDGGNKRSLWKQFDAGLPDQQRWQYSCVDVMEALAEQVLARKIHVRDVRIPFDYGSEDVYFDDVSFSTDEISAPSRRPSARNGPDPLFVRDVMVSVSGEPLTVTTTLKVAACASNLPLLTVVTDGEAEGSDTRGLDQLNLTSANWGGGSVVVRREVSASAAPSGSWDVTFAGNTISGLPTNLTADEMRLLLSTQLQLPGLTVYPWGECNNRHWAVKFSHHGGQKPNFEVDGSNVVFDGENLQTGNWKNPNTDVGGLSHPALLADLVRQPLTSADLRVTVSVGGVTSQCRGECRVNYDVTLNTELTEVTSEIDDATGAATLTMTGTGLGSKVGDVRITLTAAGGTRACDVTTASGTSITCIAANLQAGQYTVTAAVRAAGMASSSSTVDVAPVLTSVSPTEGSALGGTVLTLNGQRLPQTLDGWTGAEVTVGDAMCELINTTSTRAHCRIDGVMGADGAAVDVRAAFGERSSTLAGAFTALAENAAITQLNMTSASAAGGEYLGITAARLGPRQVDGSVTVGGANCEVTGWSDSKVTCRLPPLGNGPQSVQLNKGQLGLARIDDSVPAITVKFSISDISPRVTSTMAGSLVRIRGRGLAADCSRLNITAGVSLTCDVTSCSDTEVICRTRRRRKRHMIHNSATHPRYGEGYLWSPQHVTVAPGDLVTWRWVTRQVSSDEVGFSVHQTTNKFTDDYDGEGFNSGDKSPSGSFTTMMKDVGTFYYSSQLVGATGVRMRGVIHVVPPVSKTGKLVVQLGDVQATEVSSEGEVPLYTPAEICQEDSLPEGCEPPQGPLKVNLAVCATPSVTNITSDSADGLVAVGTTLTITGSGFSPTTCLNNVTLGSGPCDVSQASETSLTCVVTSAGLPHGSPQPLAVSVGNRGLAVTNVPSSMKYFLSAPVVSSLSPASGSPNGGTLLRITGSSLLPASADDTGVQVLVGGKDCAVRSSSLSLLTCLTPSGTAGEVAVELVWQMDGQPRTLGDMTFSYDSSKSPTVESVALSGDNGRQLRITGEKLGTDPAGVTIVLRQKLAQESVRRRRSVLSYSHNTILANPSEDEDVVKPAEEEANRESADFWRGFTDGRCESFDGFLESGLLRTAGSGSNKVSVEKPSKTPDDAPEEDFVELTPEYVATFHKAVRGKPVPQKRVLQRRRKRAVEVDSVEDEELTCNSIAVTDTMATCDLEDIPAGEYLVEVRVDALGAAANALDVAVASSITTESLSPGSVHGGATVRLTGAGFGDDAAVTIGGAACVVTELTSSSLACTSPVGEGEQPLVVTSGGLEATGPSYTFSTDATPTIASVTSEDSEGATSLTGVGALLGTLVDTSFITVGDRRCSITLLNDSGSFTCQQYDWQMDSLLPGGQYAVTFHSPEGTGKSAPFELNVALAVDSVAPVTAGLGGTTLTLTGGKFDPVDPVTVSVCDRACEVTSTTTSTITCRVPAVSEAPSASCDVRVTLSGGQSAVAAAAFTFDAALSARVTDVTPKRGGTAGGTTITITGVGLAESGNVVTIGGKVCDVTSESVTQVVCVTNGRAGPASFPVSVDVPGVGFAQAEEEAVFQYIDRWSSSFTWGGADAPSDGESVVISSGQTVLLDTSTPVLKLILIDGGELIFDPEAAFLELHAEYIVVLGGGRLQVGTEQEPHQGQAAITLHGNVRATELPVYGAKVIAVRNGTLDLHGRYLPVTWTYLASTAEVGSSTLTLEQPVSWNAGDELVIASTGDKFSMNQTEKRVIDSVSEDGTTVTLTEALEFEHISSEQTFAGQVVRMRAEVGLLTRNVKVRGAINEEFTEEVKACAAGFQPGQFDTQTCFRGRYGAENVTDQFGATIMMHAKYQDQHLVVGRLSYIEVTEAGQAFRLGRYPIHYHLNGNVTGSYVRGCAIHRTYNRAVTIHAVDYLLVEHNVAYNNMGHAFFTEDGIEQYNVIQYNLAVFTRTSSSLLNVDVTPASYWVVNPTNIVRHNAAAGGTHFGYWYRTETNPSGPSFTTRYCPKHAPMGEFYNNSAHSFGRYGLWVFSMDGYFPLATSDSTFCTGQPGVARFGQFLAWRCERGAEVVFGGALRFENFTVVDNEKSGLEMVKVKGGFGNNGPGVANSLVVGRSAIAGDSCTERGVITPKQDIFTLDGATFVNFDSDSCSALGACSQCKPLQGGFQHQMRGLAFDNSPNKLTWKWTHESVFFDTDGSLSGVEDARVLPWTDILDPSKCSRDHPALDRNPEVPTAVCEPSVTIHRMAFNNPSPSSLLYKTANFSTQHGTTSVLWKKKRLTHGLGWMALLVGGEDHMLSFENREQLTNISYKADFYFLGSEDRLSISHAVLQRPDRLSTVGVAVNGSGPPLDLGSGYHGDVYWNNDTYTFSYLVAGASRERREAGPFESRPVGRKKNIELKVYRCFFDDCVRPSVPEIPDGRPENVQLWSEATEGAWTVPSAMEDVVIPAELWVLADMVLAPIRRLTIYGALEIQDGRDNILNCTHIIVYGKLIAGTQETPFQNKFTVLLRGRHARGEDGATADIPMPAETPNLGWKALGVFGELQLHGQPQAVTWTRLNATAAAGATSLQVETPVDWPVGSEIVVTTSSFESKETETVMVSAMSQDRMTLTLDEPLQHEHLGRVFTLADDSLVQLAAKVGLLYHNVRIEGEKYDDISEESFGARVLASSYYDEATSSRRTATVSLSNVEFYMAGQDGWSDSYDPRYALAFVSVHGTDSRVINCSFNFVFSPGVGIFDSSGITLEGNVIYHTVGSGIIDEGAANILRNNLVTLMVFPGLYNGRNEPENLSWDAGIRVNKANNVTMIGNVVAGSERIGFHISGTDCAAQANWANNEAHGVLHGVHMFKKIPLKECAKVSDFYIWRAWDFGVYFDVPTTSIVVKDMTLVECTLAVLPMFYEPDPVSHEYANKTVTIENTRVVAVADEDQCDADTAPAIASYWTKGRSPRAPGGGRTGVIFGQFIASKVGAPFKPWHKPMSYPGIRGTTYLNSLDFYNFNKVCDRPDRALTTLGVGDDAQHPVIVSTIRFHNQHEDDKLFLHEPRLGSVNPSDCVDMDCDGQKHAMITDLDGSLVGSPGTVIPQAEFEFDGDERRGIGYYRVPVSALANLDGTKIPTADKMPNKGVWRDDSCTWRDAWRAYTCPGGQQRMLVIESMDADSEVRRVSPIALIADPGSSGFVDLLNGPQDHGWCFGYTCQERLSTFYSLVAPGKVYEMHFTGTPPQHLRFHFLHATEEQAIVIKIWYPKSQRYDVYYDDEFVLPNNVEAETFNIIPPAVDTPNQFVPDISSTKHGENYFARREGFLFVLIRGPGIIEIRQKPVVVLSLRYVSEEDFFESNFQENLVDLLGIEPSQLRVVNVIREDTALERRRRRRSPKETTAEFEIGEPPGEQIQNSSSSTGGGNSTLGIEQMEAAQATVVNKFQSGAADEELGVQVEAVSMVDPEPEREDPTDGVRATNTTGDTDMSDVPGAKTYAERQQEEEEASEQSAAPVSYVRPAELLIGSSSITGSRQELSPLRSTVELYMNDNSGSRLDDVGHASDPWQVEAELVSPPSGITLLQNRAVFRDGAAKFPDLMVSGVGTGLQLRFRVVNPTNVSFDVSMPGSFSTTRKVLKARVATSGWPSYVQPGNPIRPAPRVFLYDPATGRVATPLVLRGARWQFTASLYGAGSLHNQVPTGSLMKTFVPPTDSRSYVSEVEFTNLAVGQQGRSFFLLQFTVTSPDDASRRLTALSPPLLVRSTPPSSLTARHQLQLRFTNDFSSVSSRQPQFAAEVCTWLTSRYSQLTCLSAGLSSGSIRATLDTRAATEADYDAALGQLQKDVDGGLKMTDSNGDSFPLQKTLLVDGVAREKKETLALPIWAIVVISLLAALLLVLLICICCFCCKNKNSKNKVDKMDLMEFNVPINTVPPPPFTPGNINSFRVRMSIRDPNNRVAPSIIEVTSDDPLVDLRLDDMSEARSALATPGHQSPDLTDVPAESEEEKLKREAAEEQERLLREEQAAKEAEEAEARRKVEEAEAQKKRELEEIEKMAELEAARVENERKEAEKKAEEAAQALGLDDF